MQVCVRECESVLGYIQSFGGVSVSAISFITLPAVSSVLLLCALTSTITDHSEEAVVILRHSRGGEGGGVFSLNRETRGASVAAVLRPASLSLLTGRLLLFARIGH